MTYFRPENFMNVYNTVCNNKYYRANAKKIWFWMHLYVIYSPHN